jgi:hypothetical protein
MTEHNHSQPDESDDRYAYGFTHAGKFVSMPPTRVRVSSQEPKVVVASRGSNTSATSREDRELRPFQATFVGAIASSAQYRENLKEERFASRLFAEGLPHYRRAIAGDLKKVLRRAGTGVTSIVCGLLAILGHLR